MATPEFVLSLREKIGHDLLMLVGVTALVEDYAGRVLMGQRADTGEWAPVYGIVEPGEQPALAARREVKEEAGVDCVVTELVSVMAQPAEQVYPNGDRCQFVDVMYACELDPEGNARPRVGDDESLAVGWFAPDALPEPLAESARERLDLLARYRAGDGHALFSRE